MIKSKAKADDDYKVKNVLEYGNCAVVLKYGKELKENLNESAVYSWGTQYKVGWNKEEEVKPNLKVNFIPSAKQGRPLLIGETLDNQVKA